MQTFLDALDAYERDVAVHHKGYAREQVRLRELRSSSLAGLSLDEIKRAHVRAYRDEKLATGISHSTFNRFLSLVSVILRWALAEHDVGPGRAVCIDLGFAENPARDVRPTQTQFDAICEHLPGWALAWAVLARETAMRRGEIAHARWEDLDWDRRVLTLQDSKNGSGRQVPLSTTAINVLRAVRKLHDRETLFKQQADSFTQAWIRAKAAAGHRHVRGHDLRADCISRLLERGWTLPDVRRVSGHKSGAIMRYIRGGDAADLAQRMG